MESAKNHSLVIIPGTLRRADQKFTCLDSIVARGVTLAEFCNNIGTNEKLPARIINVG